MQIAHHVLFPFDKKKKVEVAYWTTLLIWLVFHNLNLDIMRQLILIKFKYFFYKKVTKIDSIIKIHWKGTTKYCIISKFFNEICIWINDNKFRNSFKKLCWDKIPSH